MGPKLDAMGFAHVATSNRAVFVEGHRRLYWQTECVCWTSWLRDISLKILQALMFCGVQSRSFALFVYWYIFSNVNIIHFFPSGHPHHLVLCWSHGSMRAKTSGWRNCGFHSGKTSCRVWWLIWGTSEATFEVWRRTPQKFPQIERINGCSMDIFCQMPAFFSESAWLLLATSCKARLRPKTFVFDFQPAMTGAVANLQLA